MKIVLTSLLDPFQSVLLRQVITIRNNSKESLSKVMCLSKYEFIFHNIPRAIASKASNNKYLDSPLRMISEKCIKLQ